MSELVSVQGLSRSFGPVKAVQDVSFALPPGQFVGLIGHNGAGKSTTLKMLMGMLRPSSGRVLVGGVDVHAQPKEARALMGVVPEEPPLYEELSALEFLQFVAELRGASNVEEVLELTGLESDARRLIREYSQGMRRKTALAAAMLGKPKLLLLDEAINGLDPPSAALWKKALRQRVDEGTTVLLSTHVVETVEAVADRVLMMAHGKLVADLSAGGLSKGQLEELFLERLAESQAEGRE